MADFKFTIPIIENIIADNTEFETLVKKFANSEPVKKADNSKNASKDKNKKEN